MVHRHRLVVSIYTRNTCTNLRHTSYPSAGSKQPNINLRPLLLSSRTNKPLQPIKTEPPPAYSYSYLSSRYASITLHVLRPPQSLYLRPAFPFDPRYSTRPYHLSERYILASFAGKVNSYINIPSRQWTSLLSQNFFVCRQIRNFLRSTYSQSRDEKSDYTNSGQSWKTP
jgi:hypothetical protein